MGKPRVVHCRRERFDVYIGRPSIYGNPFRIGVDGTRDQVIALYRQHLFGKPALIAMIKRELRGKVLGCYCKPRACHGDVLLEVANADVQPA